jgi:alkyl sulfatase BDS1-like metallo-beta-lactamase superfamily hydrolase
VRGIVDQKDVRAKKVRIVAAEHFTEHTVTRT